MNRFLLKLAIILLCLGCSTGIFAADVLEEIQVASVDESLSVDKFVRLMGGGHELKPGIGTFENGLFYGDEIKVYVTLTNKKSETFKGQYGIIFTEGCHYPRHTPPFEDENGEIKGPGYLIYESPIITIDTEVMFGEIVRTKPLIIPHSGDIFWQSYMINLVIKPEGESDWKLLYQDHEDYNIFRFDVHKDPFLTDDLSISVTSANKGEEFTIYAPLYQYGVENPEEEVEIRLYKQDWSDGYKYSYDIVLVDVISQRWENDTFYCKIPSDIETGKYDLYPNLKHAPERMHLSHFTPDYTFYCGYFVKSSWGNYYKDCMYNFEVTDDQSSISSNKSDVLSVYPNPVTDILYINGDLTDVNKYILVDMLGKIVKSGEVNTSGINASEIPSGTYILKIEYNDSEKSIVTRVIKK